MNAETGKAGTGKNDGSKTDSRDLSCFFARELFALYVEEKLDRARQAQIKNHVAKCQACALLLEKTKLSYGILNGLSKTVPTTALVEYVKREQYFWTEFRARAGWTHWPSALQWAAQLSFVAAVCVVTVHYFPWLNLARSLHKMRNRAVLEQSVGVVGQNLSQRDDDSTAGGAAVAAIGDGQGRPDEGSGNTAKIPMGPKLIPYGPQIPDESRAQFAQAATATKVEISPGAKAPVKTKDTEAEAAAVAVAAKTSAADNTADGDTAGAQAVSAADLEKTDPGSVPKMAGFVWKGSLKVDKLSDDVAARVTKAITDLGGVKAGQVELGWHRGDQRYYHFILPEENYDKLMSALNAEGIVTLTKEPHPRVIKEGHMRIIMTVEETE